MRLTVNEGVLSAAATNPTWDAEFPHLIYPTQITRSDDFRAQATGVVSSGRPLPNPVDGSVTYANAVSGGSMTVDIDGLNRKYLRATGVASSAIVADMGTANHRAMIRGRPVGAAAGTRGFGLLMRWVDVSNYLSAVIRNDLGAVQVQARVAGVASVLGTIALPVIADTDYALLVRCAGNVVSAVAKDLTNDGAVARVTVNTDQFATATKAGPYAVNPAGLVNRIYEFYGAAS